MALNGWSEFERKMEQLRAELLLKPKEIVRKLALAVEVEAKKNASTGKIPRDKWKTEPHIPGTGPGPNVRTGNLRNKIEFVDYPSGFGSYTAVVGSGAEYARAVEMGSPRWKSGAKYPYFEPAVKMIRESGAYERIVNEIMRNSSFGKG
jgi:phage gpG-like protein